MIPTKTIQLDFWRHPTDILHLVQGEADGRKIQFKITDNGSAADLTGFIAIFAIKKPDGNIVVNSATITEAELGIVETTISSQVVTTAGNAHAELHLMKEGQLSKSFRIVTKVAPGVDIDGIAPSVSEFGVLTDLITDVEAALSITDTELWPEVVENAQYFSDLAGAGRMTETVKANADAITNLAGAGRTTETVKANAQRIDNIITTPVPVGSVIAEEIIDARQGALSVGANITEVKSQLAQNVQQRVNHYYVGPVPMKYNTIASAVAAWTAAGETTSVIHICNGTYNEKVNLSGRYSALSFLGESKEGVIWKQTSGYYPDSPLSISGDVLIENITFIADHSDNPAYAYVPYTTGNTGAAYALHLDAPNVPGVVTVKNCDLYSYQNASIGCGTSKDRTLQIINCNLYSINDITETKPYGALLYHGDSASGVTGQKLVLKSSKFYADQHPLAIFLQNVGDTNVEIEMVNNTLASGAYTTNDALITATFEIDGRFTIAKNSCGNNVERMNYVDSSWQKAILTNSDSTCIMDTVDFNNMQGKTCFFKGNSVLGTLNTPVVGHAFMGMTISYSKAFYTVQYAWDVNDSYKLYMRTFSTESWSAWVAQDGITSAVQTALNTKVDWLVSLIATSENITLSTSYAKKMIGVSSENPVTITIPLNSTAPIPIGTTIKVYRRGAGIVTIAGVAGVNIESSGGKKSIGAQYEMVELLKYGTDAWVLTGSLV